jgi:hypothetical protein
MLPLLSMRELFKVKEASRTVIGNYALRNKVHSTPAAPLMLNIVQGLTNARLKNLVEIANC